MSHLVYKLKRPKVIVKDWEKKQKFKRSSLLAEIDKDIYSLLTSCPSVILFEAEAVIPKYLKGRNEKYLSHEVLTWKLKSTINWIEQGVQTQNSSIVLHQLVETSMIYGLYKMKTV